MPKNTSRSAFDPISAKIPHIIHGGDYNPDQWLDRPDILAEDIRLMKLAGCNAMSVGIFAWSALEPEEGKFEFGWLDSVMDSLAAAGISVLLATPTGARPAWMSERYPEVLRVTADRLRNMHGKRHNHCFTSPVYREKAREINSRLAERYREHPALVMWHVSNEYGGACHCDLCQDAFRRWLRVQYGDDLDRVNRAWWTGFWSHTYSSWDQIESPSPRGEDIVHGQNLDWHRFVTHQTIDFMRAECGPLRAATPGIPVTTNFMWMFDDLDYFKFSDVVDVVSWDSYPGWHGVGSVDSGHGYWNLEGSDFRLASDIAFWHTLNRSIKGGRPFMLMESTPSVTNWTAVAKLKRPGMHALSSLLAVAHGSDTVQYFQWRKSRGSSEKLHGAVVGHAGHEHTRVFREVADLGKKLARLDDVVGAVVPAECAVLFDWENRWAINDAQGPRNDGRKSYEQTVLSHFFPLWKRGVPTAVIDSEQAFDGFRLIVAPMLYMVKKGVADRLTRFVEQGGTLLLTYWSGIADEHDLCFLGGFPGPLRPLSGTWNEEIDALFPVERNSIRFLPGNELGMYGSYEVRELCEIVHAESATVLAQYEHDFYAGYPAVTRNRVGAGEVYFVAARTEDRFIDDLIGILLQRLELQVSPTDLPEGVCAQVRESGERRFTFVMNFAPRSAEIRTEALRRSDSAPVTGSARRPDSVSAGRSARSKGESASPGPKALTDLLTGRIIEGVLELGPYGVAVLV